MKDRKKRRGAPRVAPEKQEEQVHWRRNKDEEEDEDEKKHGSGSEGSEEGSDEGEEKQAPKPSGVQGIIEVENINRQKKITLKVADLDPNAKPEMSRREKEEIQAQQAKQRYLEMHRAGKTDEAKADLARLAQIKKEREESARKRDDEKKAKEVAKAAARKR